MPPQELRIDGKIPMLLPGSRIFSRAADVVQGDAWVSALTVFPVYVSLPLHAMTTASTGPAAPRPNAIEVLQRPWVFVLILCLFGFVLYSGALRFDFVWDDHEQVVSNPAIRSWSSVLHSFREHLWFQSFGSGNYYRPFFIAWSYFTFVVFHLKPWGWHLMAVGLHLLASVLVYPLARKLELSHWTAALAALLFAVHPIHVEVAAWASAASDSLVTVLFIAAFLAWLEARRRTTGMRWASLALSCLLLAAALFTKEMAVPFVAVVFAYEWLAQGQGEKTLLKRFAVATLWSLPFMLVLSAYLLAREHALHGLSVPVQRMTWNSVLMTVPSVVLKYLGLLLFPSGLNGFYYTSQYQHFSWAGTFLPSVVLLGCAALVVLIYHRSRQIAVIAAGLWFVLTLLPVLYLPAFAPRNFVRDRYVYLPSVGFCVLAAAVLGMLFRRWPRAGAAAIAAIALLLAGTTFIDQANWSNDLVLAYRGFTLNPDNPRAVENYAVTLGERNPEASVRLVQEYMAKDPNNRRYSHMMYGLAFDYLRLGNSQAALDALRQGEEEDPAVNGTVALVRRASIYGGTGQYAQSLAIFGQLLQREPDSYFVVYNCGYTYFLAGQFPEAETMLRRAAELVPDLANPHYYLGLTLLAQHKPQEAETQLRIALRISPQGADYHLSLGEALEAQGRVEEAAQEFLREMRLYPRSSRAAARLANLQKNR